MMIEDMYTQTMKLTTEQLCDIMINNSTESLYIFITLIHDIFDMKNIDHIFNSKSKVLNLTLLEAMRKKDGVQGLLEFIKQKGYTLPDITII